MEKKKLLKNKIVDTLPMLYLETVILMVLGQFLGSFILGIPVGIAIVAHPQLQKSAFLNTALMYVIFLGIWAVALFWILIKRETVRFCRRLEQNRREITENTCCSGWGWDLH